MLRFLTSLTFLYGSSILLLIIYGSIYFRNFRKGRYQRNYFPWIFLVIAVLGFSFLYFNIHPPLQLRTFSNTDHHFIRHTGFAVRDSIELGKTDTINFHGKNYNEFLFSSTNDGVEMKSAYSEEPFYKSAGDRYTLVSKNFQAPGHSLSYRLDSMQVSILGEADGAVSLSVNGQKIVTGTKLIRIGSTLFNYYRDNPDFINNALYTNERLIQSLGYIAVLRDHVNRENYGQLKFFVSGKLFNTVRDLVYDSKTIDKQSLGFQCTFDNNEAFAWGIGFLDNNRNQFSISRGTTGFIIQNRYPVIYPLSEAAASRNFSNHGIRKFIVADGNDLVNFPSVFNEGFLFPVFPGDKTVSFEPVILNYDNAPGGSGLELIARPLQSPGRIVHSSNDTLILPSAATGFDWIFTVTNSFDWNFGKTKVAATTWKLFLFGSLAFFFIVVFFTTVFFPTKISWVWQLLAVVTFLLIVTRFFLYWRYKSFPPYESLDNPSVQQLNSHWNFTVIVLTSVLLALIFGWRIFISTFSRIRKILKLGEKHVTLSGSFTSEVEKQLGDHPLIKRINPKLLFFSGWILCLGLSILYAGLSGFESNAGRHIAIFLILTYFFFLWHSYRYSPLVAAQGKSWWQLNTSRYTDMFISNPVKVLLSVTLVAVFSVIDIGFAIIFINFLLFNEAFLCINYGIAGLSAGSKRNATFFSVAGILYFLFFILNLVYGPHIYRRLLEMPQAIYGIFYLLAGLVIAFCITRIVTVKRKVLAGIAILSSIFLFAFLFFPKEKILEKAGITKYRIDVMTMPVSDAIEIAYADGKTYEPVIRAAQNQWFINTFIDKRNNPRVNEAGFTLFPHAPQSKGVKYNAQATDLVASRFILAEHGRWAILLYVLLLLLPSALMAFFYKLYPDFTNRINQRYPLITTGFSIINYLVITALLVILAATGRYIFFGQDLPFGSILSKQSILFPAILIVITILLFRDISLEQYPNRKKLLPGAIVFSGLAFLLFFLPPVFNKDKEFGSGDVAAGIDMVIQEKIQPVLDFIDTSASTGHLTMKEKDLLFADSIKALLREGYFTGDSKFLQNELKGYTRSGFSQHLDQRNLIFLDLHAGRPQLAVNDNYFRVQAPPHLHEYWTGNVYGDSSQVTLTAWDATTGNVHKLDFDLQSSDNQDGKIGEVTFRVAQETIHNRNKRFIMINTSGKELHCSTPIERNLAPGDSMQLRNPQRIRLRDATTSQELIVVIEPASFMRNLLVNGNRYYVYPRGNSFTWARNFSESISSKKRGNVDVFISVNAGLLDSLNQVVRYEIDSDSAYTALAEYAVTVADGNGRLISFNDHIKQFDRPDPNDKPSFNSVINGDNGVVSQSLLRKQIGNVNFLRMNPGPGSTFKPILFAAVASQLDVDWNAFSSSGFTAPKEYFGGEKVGKYDFEKNNGLMSSVADYLKHSDNYYHSNVLLLGSYPGPDLPVILSRNFTKSKTAHTTEWPNFSYMGQQYQLNGFRNWPGYYEGKVDFGSDSSANSKGLVSNFEIYNKKGIPGIRGLTLSTGDGIPVNGNFISPEFPLFDQQGTGMDMKKPREAFISSFRGHVKGSSQVMVSPVTMVNAFGKLVSQNRNYSLTLDPYAAAKDFIPFELSSSIKASDYLALMKSQVFKGMKDVLNGGTASALGSKLKGSKYYYYAKTGTTGDDDMKVKSKLFVIVISQKDLSSPNFNFRKNKFYTIYFTSQKGPVKQNEELQARIIRLVENSAVFKNYMKEGQ